MLLSTARCRIACTAACRTTVPGVVQAEVCDRAAWSTTIGFQYRAATVSIVASTLPIPISFTTRARTATWGGGTCVLARQDSSDRYSQAKRRRNHKPKDKRRDKRQ